MKILSSASKVAFLALIFTVCVGFLWGKLDPQEFMKIALAGATFYFANKGNSSEPFAGK